jgi:hypothetical protein
VGDLSCFSLFPLLCRQTPFPLPFRIRENTNSGSTGPRRKLHGEEYAINGSKRVERRAKTAKQGPGEIKGRKERKSD